MILHLVSWALKQHLVVRADLDIAVDVEPVVLGGEDDGAVVHEGDVEALRVLDLGLEGREQLAVLLEDGEVEVVVVVGDRDLAVLVDPHTDRVVRDPYFGREKNQVKNVLFLREKS